MKMKNPAMQFLLEQVVVWLSETGREDTEHLVEMIFSSLHCCSCQETTRILNHITMVIRRSWHNMTRYFIHTWTPTLFVQTFIISHSFLDEITLENYPANYKKGMCHRADLHQRVLLTSLFHLDSYQSCTVRHVRHVRIQRHWKAVLNGWKVLFWANNSWDWPRSCAGSKAALQILPFRNVTTVGHLSAWFSLSTTTMVRNEKENKNASLFGNILLSDSKLFIIFLNSFYFRGSDRRGVHGEDHREASCHSVWDQESVRCRQHGATHLLYLWCGLNILLLRTRLSAAALSRGALAHSLPAHCH